MPSTNGHGLKRAVLWAILYARVSTDEQARSGYSLAQQLEALRELRCPRRLRGPRGGSRPRTERRKPGEAWHGPRAGPGEPLEASLWCWHRTGTAFGREPAYTYLLRREFEEHGCELRSLNDRGDGSPEGISRTASSTSSASSREPKRQSAVGEGSSARPARARFSGGRAAVRLLL